MRRHCRHKCKWDDSIVVPGVPLDARLKYPLSSRHAILTLKWSIDRKSGETQNWSG